MAEPSLYINPRNTYVLGPYASVDQMMYELTGIRMDASGNSLWAIRGLVDDYAFAALNDGFAQYPIRVVDMHHTVSPASADGFIPLPHDVYRVTDVWDLTNSRRVPHFTFVPTQNTKFLQFGQTGISSLVRVTYIQEINWVPPDTYLMEDEVSSGYIDTVGRGPYYYEGFVVKGLTYPSKGYLSVRALIVNNSAYTPGEEVMQYGRVSQERFGSPGEHTHYVFQRFRNLSRAVYGYLPTSGWTIRAEAATIPISYAVVAPKSMLTPIMLTAQASMYQYWLSDRANYDRYTALVSRQFYTQTELLELINTLEARAAIKHRQVSREDLYQIGSIRLRRDLPK